MAFNIIIFDRWDDDSIDCIVGPFDDLKSAHEWERVHLQREKVGYRRTVIDKVLDPADGYLDATARYERAKRTS